MFLGIVTLLTALCISVIAAYYSITGLTAIFAAAAIPVIIMGSILELSKIVGCIWLHYNWDRAPWKIKSYLIFAVGALMVITSLGIFGFLSRAHLDQAVPSGDIQAQVALFDEKIKTQRDNIEADKRALAQLDAAVDQIMARSDSEQGASRSAKLRQSQKKDRMQYQNNIDQAQKEITKLQNERAPVASQLRKVESDVGPIRYLATMIYGDNPDQNLLESAVRWVIILIVAVFDPLAIVLILAASTSIDWSRSDKKRDEPIKLKDVESLDSDEVVAVHNRMSELLDTLSCQVKSFEDSLRNQESIDKGNVQVTEHNNEVSVDIEQLTKEKNEADDVISQLQKLNADLESQHLVDEKQHDNFVTLIREYEEQIEQNNADLDTMKGIISEQQSNINFEKTLLLQKHNSSELLATEIVKLTEKCDQLQHELDTTANLIVDKEKLLQTVEADSLQNKQVISSLSTELETLKNKYEHENGLVTTLQNEIIRIVAEKDNEIMLLKDTLGQQMMKSHEQTQENQSLQTRFTEEIKNKDNEIAMLTSNINQQFQENQSLLNQYNELTQLFKIKIDDFNLLKQQADEQAITTNETEKKYAQVIDEIVKKYEQSEQDVTAKLELAQMQQFASEQREQQKNKEITQLQQNINTLAKENASLKDELLAVRDPNVSSSVISSPKVDIQFEPKTSGPLIPVRPSAIEIPKPTIVTDSFPIGGNVSFGTSLPDSAARGDLFLKIDTVPSRLLKWSGSRWIELDKSKTDVYVYNNEYMQWLVNQVQNGQYDVDYLTDSEKDQIKLILEKG